MFIWGLLYSKCQLSKKLVVKESSLWRLLFLIIHQQIRSSSWVDREAVWCVQWRRIGLKRNQEARLVLRPCPSCRGRKRVRNSVKQSQTSELYALHLHCQLSSSSNPGTALLRGAVWCCLCFTSRSLSSIGPSFSTCPNETYSFWQNGSRICGLSPQRGWDLAKVASDKGRVTYSCEWGVWFWEQPCLIFNS